MRYFSIKEKLILNYVIIGIVIIVVVGLFSFYTAKKGIYDRTFDQLTSVRVLKKNQIENYFSERMRDFQFISGADNISHIISEMRKAKDSFSVEQQRSGQLPKINTSMIQYLFRSGNYKGLLLWAEGDTCLEYNQTLDCYEKLSMRPSELTSIIDLVRKSKKVMKTDVFHHKGFYEMYMAGPVYNEHEVYIGGVVLKISTEAINKIMLDNNKRIGLGNTGESYLVGPDYLMRSESRFQKDAILKVEVRSPGVVQALNGTDSIMIFKDYRDVKVLSSFSPVKIGEKDWAIMAEIDLDEAMVPMAKIRNNILLISTIICLFLFIFAYLASLKITSPIIKLRKASKRIGRGDFKPVIDISTNDEIGDLAQAFRDMSFELDQMTNELKMERMMRLRSVIDGQEIERQRLSRDIHDGLGQQLIALRLKLESAQSEDAIETKRKIKEIKDYVDDTIEGVKRISNNLMPAVLLEFGLSRALRNLIEDLDVQSESEIVAEIESISSRLSGKSKTYIYRIAQEALNNAIKYAHAERIVVCLKETDSYITLDVQDNGCGFDQNQQSLGFGNGIQNMEERAGLMDAKINIESRPGKGTKIFVRIPVK